MIVNNSLDLVYSPDDNGFYFQDSSLSERCSKIYPTKSSAMVAYRTNSINWMTLVNWENQEEI